MTVILPDGFRRLGRRRSQDQGSATPWAIGVVAVVALLSGAVLDGGNAMAARVAALDLAQQAARAGANCLDATLLRDSGLVRLDPPAAEAAAQRFLDQVEATGTVQATDTRITVTVERDQPTLLLDVVGVKEIHTSATATAAPATSP
ncbi:MAG: hypothetical protein HKP61_15615 [Dactylosporangium sp.]|nr:hypothetical protein [Dactylosporangium sp.]NNJ62334.1 hypothetical protein [Dactylosporangium sp.]